MRNISRNKFLLCFRPVVDIDDMLESEVANKHDVKKSSNTRSEFFDQVPTKISESWIMQHPPKRTISRVIKTLVFPTMLKTKTRRKNRYPNDSFGSRHSYDSEDSQSVLSSSSSSSSASSCSSPTESKSLTKYSSTKEKQKESNYGKKHEFECSGIYLILISLAFTVFLGKIFGIMLTLMLLYLFSLLSSSYSYKKKLPSCLEPKDRVQFGRCARRELLQYHSNGH
ncbi:hypothetical protein TanjilG_03081 [Lupinus angustifolius]|uniref:Uncharacterized protein n=1 Tax=Lupinus angustifolius TaxID=3871 RepID=A0A4P1RDK5_LUPAN|nr:PREDICTED: uncharacterized protein LOC109352502 [Lupinus angustifolius]OIW08405.1 hypothetical protein TanjilG_03081 [Lupinus angustifolius]